MSHRRAPLHLLLATLVLSLGAAVQATVLQVGFNEEILTSSLDNPTAMAVLPDGRVLVTQQGGALRVVDPSLLPANPLLPAAAITLTVNANGERGLLGVAVDPAFGTNGFIYLYYTVATAPIHNRVSRFTMTGGTAGSEFPLIDLDNLSSATNHNGGALHFGNDGKLYVAVGENANGANSQSLGNRLGKILRINTDAANSFPADNPFVGTATGNNRQIWALGLRNPYTFAFRRTTGAMFINDVGQSTFEEIDLGTAGANYGWPTTEGPTSNPSFVSPLYTYQHTTGTPTGCAITGGTFYDPVTLDFSSAYVGKYFFADFCGNFIYLLDPATATATAFATGVSAPVDLQVDVAGRLLYLGHTGSGVLGRISAKPAQQFYTLTPCRLLDTRGADAPAIAANATRAFAIAGKCGVPAGAVSVSVNATAVTPTSQGDALLFPGNFTTAPTANAVSFRPGLTRAGNVVVALATDGTGSIRIRNVSSAALQFVVDVNGYFQ